MSCAVRGRECKAEVGVEYRVNMTEDRDSWQAPHFLPACCLVEAERLAERKSTRPNGKPRRWVEKRQVEPWTSASRWVNRQLRPCAFCRGTHPSDLDHCICHTMPTTTAPVSGVAARAKGEGDE